MPRIFASISAVFSLGCVYPTQPTQPRVSGTHLPWNDNLVVLARSQTVPYSHIIAPTSLLFDKAASEHGQYNTRETPFVWTWLRSVQGLADEAPPTSPTQWASSQLPCNLTSHIDIDTEAIAVVSDSQTHTYGIPPAPPFPLDLGWYGWPTAGHLPWNNACVSSKRVSSLYVVFESKARRISLLDVHGGQD